eukprot:3672683-Alexandrium_andersonii.AAC.1
MDPLAFRGLLILPTVYRTWAKVRLRQLSPWIRSWAPPHLFSGLKGRGAQDAWISTALDVESCRVWSQDIAVTAFDMFKAFDQLCRPLLYCLMLQSGWPVGPHRCTEAERGLDSPRLPMEYDDTRAGDDALGK